jgi:hypothetical protein
MGLLGRVGGEGYAYKRSHLVALWHGKISTSASWSPEERRSITSDVRRRPEMTGNRPNRRE